MRIFFLVLLLGMARDHASWIVQTSGMDTNLRGVSAASVGDASGTVTEAVWVSGSNGVILRSDEGGKTWTRLTVKGGEGLDFRGIRAFDGRTAYVMSSGEGEKSRIYKTTDGGETWMLQYSDARREFFLDALACVSEKRCWALSDPVEGKFLLARTEDGEHWKEMARGSMPAALPSEGAFAASNTSLAICGEKEIFFGTGGPAARVLRSMDMGRNWTVAATPIASGTASAGIFSVACAGKAVVAVGGDYREANRPLRTASYSLDHGATWQLSAEMPGGYRSAVAALDGKRLLAVGPNGEDVSLDGGVHWKAAGAMDLNAIFVLDAGNVWAVGAKGMVMKFAGR